MGHVNRLVMFAAAFGALVATCFADDLGPGSTAPPIQVKSWIKGSPVTAFDKSKIYVVEFWATWCGPCLQSIPHLTELAHKNKDVTFVGVSIWEDDVDGSVGKFVANMGDKMDYTVAYSGNKDGMAASWMEPAAQNGIPSAFVIKNGQIAWIGHPMQLEKPLEEIKAGTFDSAAFKAAFEARAVKAREQIELNRALKLATDTFDAGRWSDAHKQLDKLLAANPMLKGVGESIKFDWLATEDPTAWEAKAKTMAESNNAEQMQMVTSLALSRAQTEAGAGIARKAMGIALKAAGEKDFIVNLYAVNVYEATKDYKLALVSLNRVLDMYPTSPAKNNPEFKTNYEKRKKAIEAKLKGN